MEFILFSLRLIGARIVNSPPQLGISCFYKHLYRFLRSDFPFTIQTVSY